MYTYVHAYILTCMRLHTCPTCNIYVGADTKHILLFSIKCRVSQLSFILLKAAVVRIVIKVRVTVVVVVSITVVVAVVTVAIIVVAVCTIIIIIAVAVGVTAAAK